MKKFLVCILALVLLAPFLASCNDNSVGNNPESGAVPSEEIKATVAVKDMDGREFHILCWDFSSKSILGYTGEVMYDEENPTSVDEAKKIVVDYVEENYNCKILGEKTNTAPLSTTIRNQVASGLPYYDICFDSLLSVSPLAIEKQIMDLREISTIDLSAEWWDQNAVADLSIGNKVYFTCGDINTYDDQGTWCILFNKALKSKLGIEEDFYQLVRDDKWTFDKLVEICSRDITADINGDKVFDEKDRWAFGGETYNLYVHLVAAGQKITRKDANDLPYLVAAKNPEETYAVLGKAIEFYNDNSTVMVANAPPYTNKGFENVHEATVHKAFIEGRELFYMCGLIHAASFRVMEDEFGILPIPKYYETQDRYYHTVSQGNSTVMYIPVGATEPEDIGLVVSALAEQSKKYVTPAYYDVQLKYRDSHDDESGEMLDIIFASRTFDLGAAFNWGGALIMYMQLDPNIASRFESGLSSAQNAMDKMISELK